MTSVALDSSAPANDGATDIRVMVVDDSTIIRTLIANWIDNEPDMQVVGRCRNGLEAVQTVERRRPGVIVLDIEMPEMDGLTALPELRRLRPEAQIVMASTLTRRNAEISMRALSLGAADYIAKPESRSVGASEEFQKAIIEKVRALGGAGRQAGKPFSASKPTLADAAPASPGYTLRAAKNLPAQIIAIGSSTGGPQALARVVSDIARVSAPILIVQHMPKMFTAILAEHLQKASGRPAAEAQDGERIERERIYVAPGGYHMVVEGTGPSKKIRLNEDPPVNFCRPAVDPFFESVAQSFGPTAVAVVLTGMGHDGAAGGVAIADAGGAVVAQDEATSVVWGMPGATAMAGACCAIAPLEKLGQKILTLSQGAGR